METENSKETAERRGEGSGSSAVVRRINKYLSQLSPHIKQREAAKLLFEAKELIGATGVFDIEGNQIKEGDTIEARIRPHNCGGDIKRIGKIKFLRAAYRFIEEDRESQASCLGDFAYNCNFKILDNDA